MKKQLKRYAVLHTSAAGDKWESFSAFDPGGAFLKALKSILNPRQRSVCGVAVAAPSRMRLLQICGRCQSRNRTALFNRTCRSTRPKSSHESHYERNKPIENSA
jgi:hypothetical protein